MQIMLSLLHCILFWRRDEPLIDKLTNQLQCCFEVCYEPTDENKASKPFLSDSWKALTYISPNLQELRAINRTLGNPLPAGIEYSEESVTILGNLDPGEEHFPFKPPFQANWVITQWRFTSILVSSTLQPSLCGLYGPGQTDDLSKSTVGLG